MPPEPQSVTSRGYTPVCAFGAAGLTASPPGPSPSAAYAPQQLVFGSWRPEDFEILPPTSPTLRPSALLLSTAAAAADAPAVGVGASECVEPAALLQACRAAPMDPMDVSIDSSYAAPLPPQPPTPAPHCAPPALSALHHLLIGANCGSLLQQHPQLAAASTHLQHQQNQQQQLYLVPSALPMFAPQLIHYFGGLSGMLAAVNPAAPWGAPQAAAVGSTHYQQQQYDYQHAASRSSSSYPPPAPAYTGFWLNGLYFPSYEHFIAYRRRTIAYNFHYFGIRPFFRPPPGLPRPRPPTAAAVPKPVPAAAPAPSADCASAAAVVSAPVAAGSRAGNKTPYDDAADSPCCSPGSSSTCSAADSDDAASDVSPAEQDADMLHDAPQVVPLICLPEPSQGVVAAFAGLVSQPSSTAAEPPVAAGHARHLPVAGLACAPQRVCAFAEVVAASAPAALGVCCAAAAPLKGVLAPVRCGSSGDGGCERAREETRQAVAGGSCSSSSSSSGSPSGSGGGSPMAGVCPQWLERQFGALLDRVVGDALLGREDAP